jgi:ATP phosphoribosyltransferase regulatory subunit
MIDFSLQPSFDYYTGLVFELYAPRSAVRLGSGGRYDRLLAEFGQDLPAAGFVYELQALEDALSLQHAQTQEAGRAAQRNPKPLRIAIPKGTLYKESVALLQAAGISLPLLDDPGRQLCFGNEEFEIIIAKPSDVAIYVSYGAADCGIGGRDILVEANFPLLQLVDLKFGVCEFVVAAPKATRCSLREMALELGVIRVATKYPRLAHSWFDARGIQVELVKLNGNIELAPLIGIAHVVVDITQTGTTLRENDLCVLEHMLPSTARFVANPVSARSDSRIADLSARFADKCGA